MRIFFYFNMYYLLNVIHLWDFIAEPSAVFVSLSLLSGSFRSQFLTSAFWSVPDNISFFDSTFPMWARDRIAKNVMIHRVPDKKITLLNFYCYT